MTDDQTAATDPETSAAEPANVPETAAEPGADLPATDDVDAEIDAEIEAELDDADRMTDAVEHAVADLGPVEGAAGAVADEAAEETAADAVAAEDATPEEGLSALADAEDLGEYEVLLDEELIEEEVVPVVESPFDRPGKWYVLHTQSGYENKVRQNIEARARSMNMEGKVYEVAIPMEDVVEFRQGKKVVVQKKMFPGYLLVRCRLDDDSWYVIRNTPGVTGFVGAGNKPSPLRRKEVETFLQVKVEAGGAAPKAPTGPPRHGFEIHETVRVKEGPFADFSGEIVEINEDQLKVKVLVNIFGRETPVELEFAQVAKL
jgi:transcriptional antiterminator NusG